MTCSTKGCFSAATHRVTVRDGRGQTWTADVCDLHAKHHEEVHQLLSHPTLAATATVNPPDMHLVSVTKLIEVIA